MSKSRRMGVGRGLEEYQRAAIERVITVHSGAPGWAEQYARTASLAISWAKFVQMVMTETTPAIFPSVSITNISTLLQSSAISISEARDMLAEQSLDRLHRPGKQPPKIEFMSTPTYDEILARLERKREEFQHIWLDDFTDIDAVDWQFWHYRRWAASNPKDELLVRIPANFSRRYLLGNSAAWHFLDIISQQNLGDVRYYGVPMQREEPFDLSKTPDWVKRKAAPMVRS